MCSLSHSLSLSLLLLVVRKVLANNNLILRRNFSEESIRIRMFFQKNLIKILLLAPHLFYSNNSSWWWIFTRILFGIRIKNFVWSLKFNLNILIKMFLQKTCCVSSCCWYRCVYIFRVSIKTTVKYFVEILLFLSILNVFSILKRCFIGKSSLV